MLTNAQKSAHNGRVRLNYRTGCGNPNLLGAQPPYVRMSGFFVRIYHFLTSETCGHLYGGRVLTGGISTPQRLAHHRGKWCEISTNSARSLAMQVISAAQTQPSTFNLPFAITALLKNQLTSGEAKDYAIMSCSEAKNILIAAADSAESDSQMLSTAGLLSVIKSAASILECAELLVNETEK
uniref:Uncharacterized protein n=1 Tax=Podoviridae sp. ct9P15 TaxID=2826543 RepID=A0A8S5MF71_9CAUD|nr:MAG TPA: hypothetical protein [Podoviridae sp. ct9P15]